MFRRLSSGLRFGSAKTLLSKRPLSSAPRASISSQLQRGDPAVKIVLEQLLRTIGTAQDVEQYIHMYGSLEEQKFAVIKVGGEVIMNELDIFAYALTFLHRAGLFPIVIHGAGPQMNDYVKQQGLEPQYMGGMRVTDAKTLSAARKVFLETNLKLVNRLEQLGTPARPIVTGVFEARVKNPALGFVGEITSVSGTAIAAAIEAGSLPIVAPLAESDSGQILNINADVAARELAIKIKPLKTIMINAKGGWVEPDGRKLSVIDMRRDYQTFAQRDYTGRQGTLLKLNELKQILDNLPNNCSIALTSASGLVKELFTHRGEGTIVLNGEQIQRYNSLSASGIRPDTLFSLLHEAAVHECPEETADSSVLDASYMDKLVDPSNPLGVKALYLSESHTAAAVLTQPPNSSLAGTDAVILDKFAVSEQGLGRGVGNALWSTIIRDFPNVIWRTHARSSVKSWFLERASGTESTADFTTMWAGPKFGLKNAQFTLQSLQAAAVASSFTKKK